MKPFASFVTTVVIAAIVGGSAAAWMVSRSPAGGVVATPRETAYEKVMRTGTLTCGYWVAASQVSRNKETGKLEGMPVSVVEEMARRLSLKIEWTEEVTFGNMLMGLETRRYDAVCTGAFITAGRSRHSAFTIPFVYSGMVAVGRANDNRFDGNLKIADNPDYIVSGVEGDITGEIAMLNFPKARKLMVPQYGGDNDMFLNLMGKKADVIFSEAARTHVYAENNPGLIKILNGGQPVRFSQWAIPVTTGEHDLLALLNGALSEMIYDGTVARLVRQNQPFPGAYSVLKPPVEAAM